MSNDKSIQKPIELKDIYTKSTEIHNTLKELLKWAKFSGIKEVKPVLESKIDTDVKKIVYFLSDGSKGTRDIAKTVGSLSHASVSNYWQDWEKAGLGESFLTMGGGTRFKRSFDLEDFGIKIPPILNQESQQVVSNKEQSDMENQTNAI